MIKTSLILIACTVGASVSLSVGSFKEVLAGKSPPSVEVSQAIQLPAFHAEVLSLINEARSEAGLGELSWDSNLYVAAQSRAEEASIYFSHTRPNGADWYTVDASLVYGENLAKGYDTAEGVVDGWMNSKEHRENILDVEFKTIALGMIEYEDCWYYALLFGY